MSHFHNTASVQNQIGVQIIHGNAYFGNDTNAPHERSEPSVDVLDPERLLDDSILASLAFPQMFDRRRNVDQAHSQTCQWIFDLTEYKDWKTASRGLLWIKGKPGSGKSTLMSYLYSNIYQQQNESEVRLDFFFSARGAPLQRTLLGMLRSLSNQIFYQDFSVRSLLRKLFRDKCASFGSSQSSWEWQLAELKTVFLEMVSSSAQNNQVTIFIDALDEAGEKAARDAAQFLHSINDIIESQDGSAKTCISCRHYPIPSTARTVEVHMERYNGEDIKVFVQDYLRLHDLSPNLMDQQQNWLALVEDLVKMARGVFQWIILVVPMVAKWMSDGDTPEEIHERLSEVPKELRDIYKHIIQHVIDRYHRARSLRLFQWVTLAVRPLTLTTLRHAMAALDAEMPRSRLQGIQNTEPVGSQGDIESLIKAWSGSLIEIVKSGNAYDPDPIVQVIHQSVNDFLADIGLSILIALSNHTKVLEPPTDSLSSATESVRKSHETLYSSCLQVLSARGTEVISNSDLCHNLQMELVHTRESFSFLRYASLYCLKHSESAMKHQIQDLQSESQLLSQALPFLRNSLKSREDSLQGGIHRFFYTGGTTMHVAAAVGWEELVHYRLRCNDDPHARDKLGWTALHFAVENNHLNVVEILFRAGSDIQKCTNRGATPLLLAASRGHTSIFKWLMDRSANLKVSNNDTENVLYAAASSSCLSICKLCIDAGVDVNARGGFHGNALQAAAVHRNDKEILQLLLKAGADVNADGGEFGNALQAAAACRSHKEVVQLLLQAGAKIDAQGGKYGSALQAAAWAGNGEVVQLLLEAGADVNAQGGVFGNALQAVAANENDEEPMRLLLNAGANVNAQGGAFVSALQAAANGGGDTAVRLLLDAGADIHVSGGLYGDVLQAAAVGGSVEVVQILLEAGADTCANRGRYGNALQAAATSQKQSAEKVRVLLKAGIDANSQGGEYGNALQAAAAGNNKQAVQVLLEAGASINARGGRYGTALQAAAFVYDDDEELIRLLLEAGADVNTHAGKYGNALQAAAAGTGSRDANEGAVRLLIEAGADVNARGGWFGCPLEAALIDRRGHTATLLRNAGAAPYDPSWKCREIDDEPSTNAIHSDPGTSQDVHLESTSYGNLTSTASVDENSNPSSAPTAADARKGKRLLRKFNRLFVR